jgi:hypothetical protein
MREADLERGDEGVPPVAILSTGLRFIEVRVMPLRLQEHKVIPHKSHCSKLEKMKVLLNLVGKIV